MNTSANKLFARMLPYIGGGIAIIMFIGLFVIFSYILLLGAILGLIIYTITTIKRRLFSSKRREVMVQQGNRREYTRKSNENNNHSGNTYDHM